MTRALALILTLAATSSAQNWPALEKQGLDLLQKYVRIKSINPPADTRETAALLKGFLEQHDFQVKLFPSGPGGQVNLLTRLTGSDRSKRPLLLLNHMDVVPVDAKAWSIDPFGAEIRNGSLWGRGALDMKGIGVQQIIALVALKESGTLPSRDIILLSTADEETNGARGIQWMMDNHADEIASEFVLDEGGVVSQDLLSTGKLVFGIAVGEKQMLWLKLRAKGTAGHGSQPIADNANDILLKAIDQAKNVVDRGKPNPVVQQMRTNLGSLADNKFTRAIQRNTMSVTTLRSGVGDPPKANVIPSVAEATLDCRLLPGVNADEFLSEIKARINDPRVTVEILSAPTDAGTSDSDTALFRAISAAAVKNYPGAQVTPMLIPYGTDSVKLRKQGVKAYGVNPMLLDAATMATMHSDEERIPLDSFYRGMHVFYDILRTAF